MKIKLPYLLILLLLASCQKEEFVEPVRTFPGGMVDPTILIDWDISIDGLWTVDSMNFNSYDYNTLETMQEHRSFNHSGAEKFTIAFGEDAVSQIHQNDQLFEGDYWFEEGMIFISSINKNQSAVIVSATNTELIFCYNESDEERSASRLYYLARDAATGIPNRE